MLDASVFKRDSKSNSQEGMKGSIGRLNFSVRNIGRMDFTAERVEIYTENTEIFYRQGAEDSPRREGFDLEIIPSG
jgi:hypothetical protein